MLNSTVQRAWEERVISEEKGHRIVHYRLLDTTPRSLLAVVGIERSQRHMTYTVTDQFLRVFGSTGRVHPVTKWKSRKAVVRFLASIASVGGPIFANSNQREIDPTPHPKKVWMARFSSESDNLTDEEEESGSDHNQANNLKENVENSPVLSQALNEKNVHNASKPEGSREVVLQSPGPSAPEANRKHHLEEKATRASTSCASSSIVGKRMRDMSGVGTCRSNGSSDSDSVAVGKRRRHTSGVGPIRPNRSSASSVFSLNDDIRRLQERMRRSAESLNQMIDELKPVREGLGRLVPDVVIPPLPPHLPNPPFPPLPGPRTRPRPPAASTAPLSSSAARPKREGIEFR